MSGTDAELLAMFAAWRTEIDAEPYTRDDAFHAALRDWNVTPRTSSPGEPAARPPPAATPPSTTAPPSPPVP